MTHYIIAILLLGHGLAHLSGVFAPWTKEMQGYLNAAWLFSGGATLQSTAGRAYSLIWLAAVASLVAAGAGVFLRQSYWIPAAILGSAFSLAAIIPWWLAVPPGAKAGAVFDLIILALLLSPLRGMIEQVINLKIS